MTFHGKEGKKGRGKNTYCQLCPIPSFLMGLTIYLTAEVLEVSGLKAMGIKVRGKRLALGSFRCPEERRDDGT